jgi:surface antigen
MRSLKYLIAAVLLTITAPAVIAAPAVVTSNHTTTTSTRPQPAPIAPLFPWVPAGGYPDHFPFGQCTWWAAYSRRVSWWGDAGNWLANAAAQGVPTSSVPSVAAIVVYRPGPAYSVHGHVAIVIAIQPAAYTVSEMNFIGEGLVDTRTVSWPDPNVSGFIPLGATG